MSGPESNGNKGVQQSTLTGAPPPLQMIDCHMLDIHLGGVLLFYGNAVGVFYGPSRLGCLKNKDNFYIRIKKKEK